MATEKQIQYLNSLISKQQNALQYGTGTQFFDYLTAKYPDATTEEKREMRRNGQRAQDEAEFVQGLGDYLSQLNPEQMSQDEASRQIDALKVSARQDWVVDAIAWMLN